MASIQKAISLVQVHRYEDAVAELHLVLAQDPEDDFAHYQLATAYLSMPDSDKKALEAIDGALGIQPDDAGYLATKAIILNALNRDKEALVVVTNAIASDPGPYQWYARATVLMGLRRWSEALVACEKALELDPDYDSALDLKNLILRVQGNLDSAEELTMEQLSRNAESPLALANAGWTQLQKGERDKAEELFRDALRLEPDNEYARSGLVEAFKSRSRFYRLYLSWVFMLQRMEGKSRWILILGLYFGFKIGRGLLTLVHPLLGVAVLVLYLGLCFGTFLAPGIGHGLLLKDRFARHALTSREKIDGVLVGGLFFGGIFLAAIGLLIEIPILAYLGLGMLVASVPASVVARNLSRPGQLVFGGIGALAIVGALHSWFFYRETGEVISGLGGLALVAAALSTWLTAVSSLVNLD